jgi:hypothetical protein
MLGLRSHSERNRHVQQQRVFRAALAGKAVSAQSRGPAREISEKPALLGFPGRQTCQHQSAVHFLSGIDQQWLGVRDAALGIYGRGDRI